MRPSRSGARAGWALIVVLMLSVLPIRGSMSGPAVSARRRAPAQVAFTREGDIWTVAATGGSATRRTTRGHFSGLAAFDGGIACLSEAPADVYVLREGNWEATRATSGGQFVGTPSWWSRGRGLLVGRSTTDGGGGGLWLLDPERLTSRRLLASAETEPDLDNRIKVSPSGARVLASGRSHQYLFVQVLDLRTGKRVSLPKRVGRPWSGGDLLEGWDLTWLDENSLLVAACPELSGPEGVRRIDLQTGRAARWLRTLPGCVVQVCRAPGGRRFALGLGHFPPDAGARSLAIVDEHGETIRKVAFHCPFWIGGFSPDGSRLLLLVLVPTPKNYRTDLYVVDVGSLKSHLIAQHVTEAVWMADAL